MNRAPGPAVPGAATARRAPFVLLVVVLLGSGLIALLLLNSSLNQGSFELSKLEKQTDELSDERQSLQQEVDQLSAPGALEQRAQELGMVPGGSPAFLNPDGTVAGVPAPATGQPSVAHAPGPLPPLVLDPTPAPTPSASAAAEAPAPAVLPSASPLTPAAGTGAPTTPAPGR
ncbi:septum formation initiator family protein [Streptomyces sp. Rer75]|uniref:septum formation initiator family protein n=2 Tax=unclassified Streptomyces TaxID=2593676 RepID=UPI0015D08FC0|nr:septum formation initiator family protein [Streptomyces sp. Rer75]QLH21191.1 septum formation initiator family protein [Streptomyces sp. Rer75]